MDESITVRKARILPLKKEVLGSDDFEVSEVTRSIFTGAWNAFVDESGTAAMKLNPPYVSEPEVNEVIYPIPAHLSLVE